MDVSFPRVTALAILDGTHPTIRLVSDDVVDGVHTIVATDDRHTITGTYIGAPGGAPWAGQLEVAFDVEPA